MMGQVVEVARTVGPIFYMMCAAGIAHVLLCGVMLLLAKLGRRAPLFIYALMPCAVFLFGMVGVTLARQEVQDASAVASVDTLDKLVLFGLSLAYAPEFAAGMLTSILLVFATLCAGAGNVLGAAPGRRWVWRRGGVVAGIWAVVMGLAVVLPGALFGMERSMLLIVCVVCCGAGAMMGSMVESDDEEGARRVARGRFALAMLPAFALLAAGVAEQGRLMQSYGQRALKAGIWENLLSHVSGQSLQVILEQAWSWPVVVSWMAGLIIIGMIIVAMSGGGRATRSIGSVLDASTSALLMMVCVATFIANSVMDVPVEGVLDRTQVIEVVAQFGPGLSVSGEHGTLALPDPSSCVLIHQSGWLLLETTPHESTRGCQPSRALEEDVAFIDEKIEGSRQDTPCVQELGAVNAAICPDVRPLLVLDAALDASQWSRKIWHPERVIDMDVLVSRDVAEADPYCATAPRELGRLSSYLYWVTCFKTQAMSWRRFEVTFDAANLGMPDDEPPRSERVDALFGSGYGALVAVLTREEIEVLGEVDAWRAGDARAMEEVLVAMRQRVPDQEEVLIVVDEGVTMQRVLDVCLQMKRAIDDAGADSIQCRLTDVSARDLLARVHQEHVGLP